MTDRPLGIREAAARLGIHPNTLTRMSPKELPYWQFGVRRDRRYSAADIERYIEARRVR